jgi:hypothetical protein
MTNNAKDTPPKPNDSLWIKHGLSPETTVASYLQSHSKGFEKPLFWLEPALQLNTDNSGGRLKGFKPFCDTLLGDLPPLDEAYLFARHSGLPYGLHVVATGKGCRWFELGTWQIEGCEKIAINERSYDVLSRTDFTRFFGDKHDWNSLPKGLQVIEYWNDSGLLAWWLGTKN